MEWRRILNPWGVLRDAELENAALVQKCDDLWRRCEDAEHKAFQRASAHYYSRTKMIEAQLEYTQKQMLEVVNLTPPKFAIRPDKK